jgi:ribosomal protein S18 acetylase RimI-like enzyme
MAEVLDDLSPDALVRAVERHQKEQSAVFARAQGGVVLDEPDLFLYVSGRKVYWGNGAMAARLPDDRTDARIAEAIRLFGTHGVPAAWWVGPLSLPADLDRRLRGRGFEQREDMPWLAADLQAVEAPATAPDLRIERVAAPEMDDLFVRAMVAGFGADRLAETALREGAKALGSDPEGPWVRFVGLLEDRPVASAGVTLAGGVAGIYNVATSPECRRRGYASAMTGRVIAHARELGYRVGVLGSSPMARSLYEGMGFREVCRMGVFVLQGPETES